MHEIDAHINFCLDKGGDDQEMKEDNMKSESETTSSTSSSGNMSTQQMAACAKAILDAKQKDTEVSLVNMLQRFKTLGI